MGKNVVIQLQTMELRNVLNVLDPAMKIIIIIKMKIMLGGQEENGINNELLQKLIT